MIVAVVVVSVLVQTVRSFTAAQPKADPSLTSSLARATVEQKITEAEALEASDPASAVSRYQALSTELAENGALAELRDRVREQLARARVHAIEIDLSNPKERLYPGTYAEVSLEMNRRPDALTVPAAAVDSDGDGNFVYAVIDNRITRLAVKTGLTDGARIEVTAGLSDETPVVANTKGVPPLRTAVQLQMVRENF